MPPTAPLLQIRDLTVHYLDGKTAPIAAVDGVSLDLSEGEVVGLLGESGCGKSSLALAILGLLPVSGRIASGSIRFRDRQLEALGEKAYEKVRGAEIGLVFQEPALALHPLRWIGEQVAEVLRAHRSLDRRSRRREAEAILAEVGLTNGYYKAYPHELSGGQRQRVVIAQALACRPALVVADEPTASLDPTTERQVLDLLLELKSRLGLAFLYISHDPEVLRAIADRILVMYAGRLIETGPASELLDRPRHPYTEALLRCLPPLPSGSQAGRRRELPAIPGSAPLPRQLPPGCRFAPRCEHRMPACTEGDPKWTEPRPGRRVACIRSARE